MTTRRSNRAETPYLRIKRAAIAGHSVLLKPHECADLYNNDTAIRDRADMDDEDDKQRAAALKTAQRQAHDH